jgi:hypothetical protein
MYALPGNRMPGEPISETMPPALPPPPPAIQAPAPAGNSTTAAQPFQSFSQQSQTLRAHPSLRFAYKGEGYRWEHIHHWKGKRSASLRSRSNRRKATKQAKR